MSANQEQKQSNTPILLKTFLGKVHYIAREIGNPESFDGIVFYKANKTDHGKPNSYHVVLNNSTELTNDQINRIVDIINESKPTDKKFNVESKYHKHKTSKQEKTNETNEE